MDKTFLLMAGMEYYPSSGTGDWVGVFSTFEEAKNQIIEGEITDTFGNFKYGYIKIGDREYDWYGIVNLKEWCNNG